MTLKEDVYVHGGGFGTGTKVAAGFGAITGGLAFLKEFMGGRGFGFGGGCEGYGRGYGVPGFGYGEGYGRAPEVHRDMEKISCLQAEIAKLNAERYADCRVDKLAEKVCCQQSEIVAVKGEVDCNAILAKKEAEIAELKCNLRFQKLECQNEKQQILINQLRGFFTVTPALATTPAPLPPVPLEVEE